jgi:hypothetical protein
MRNRIIILLVAAILLVVLVPPVIFIAAISLVISLTPLVALRRTFEICDAQPVSLRTLVAFRAPPSRRV